MRILNKELFYSIFWLKIFTTLITLFGYGSVVNLGDSHGYAVNNSKFSISTLTNRTDFTEFFYSSITFFVHSPIITHLISSLLVGFCIYYTFKDSYRFINKYVLYMSLLLPQFWIWTGVATKELLAVATFSVFVKQVINVVKKEDVNYVLLFVTLGFGFFLRPHYGAAYIYLLISSMVVIFICRKRKMFISKSVSFLFFLILILIAFFFLYLSFDFWEDILIGVMKKSKNYFIYYEAKSTRYDLQFATVSDFFYMLPSGVFMGLVGPTFNESLVRPLFFIPFVEGILFLLICFFLYYSFLVKSFKHREHLFFSLFLFSFVPALVLIILAHYPLGIHNPGTALRYKQTLIPLMIFFPLGMLGYFSEIRLKKVI